MSGAWLEWLSNFGAIALVGMAVKLMDDALDVEFDASQGKRTMAARIGRATLPYALVCALIAAALNVSLTVALFLGCYVVGMFSTWRDVQPTRLPAWLEMCGAFVLSGLLTGWLVALWGVAIAAAIDWLDDVMDVADDRISGQRNVAARLGVVETLLMTLCALAIAVLLNPIETTVALVAVGFVATLADGTTLHGCKAREEQEQRTGLL